MGDIRISARDDERLSGSRRPAAPPAGLAHRAEPSLGRLDDLDEGGGYRAAGPGPARRRSARRGWIAPVAVALVLIAAAAAWHWQDRLRALVPNTQLNDTLARAQKALADDKLLGEGGARELFQSIRAQDPDNDPAREGLNRVGERLLVDARAALQSGDLATARVDLDAANEVLGGGARVEEVKAALDAVQAHGAKVETLLARADAALAAHRLFDADGAAMLYRQILDVDAGNVVARHGIDNVAAAQAQLAREALAQGDLGLADQRIAQLSGFAPNDAAIPELGAELAQRRTEAAQAQTQDQAPPPPAARAEETRQPDSRRDDPREAEPVRELSPAERARIENLLGEAGRALAAGNLMDPGGAYDQYRAVLAIDGNEMRALDGLKRIAPRARELFDADVAAGRLNEARGDLGAIADVDPGNPASVGLRARLANAYLDQAERYAGQGRRNDARRALDAARQLGLVDTRGAALEARIDSLPAGG